MDYPSKKNYTKIKPLIDWYIIAKYWLKGIFDEKIFEFKNFKTTYFVFLLIIYLIGTNTYFNYEQSLIFGGADGFSYFEISKAFPKLSDIPLQPIHAERFFYPYLIGFLINYFL